jgi:hypothetical protein
VRVVDLGSNESPPSNLDWATPYDITPFTTTTIVTCSAGVPPLLCPEAGGLPDDSQAPIFPSEVITIDFGIDRGIIDGTGPDMVFYENEVAGPPRILMDYTIIEISADGTNWYTVFAWDGTIGGVVGTNVDSYAADGEGHDEVIPLPLHVNPVTGVASGIEIDIGVWAPPGYSYHLVRVSYPVGGPAEAEFDAIERLN